MKNIITASLFLIASLYVNAQNDSISKTDNYYKTFNNYWKTVTFKIGGGAIFPQGELKKHFNVSPLVELSVDFPVTKSKSLEIAVQFVIPEQEQSFEYIRLTDTVQTSATFIFNPMLRFKKNFSKSSSNKLMLSIGVGASVINTNARNTNFLDISENRKKYEAITAMLISPSIDFIKTFKNNNEFTFSLGLNYSPYNIEGAVAEDIGSISITPRILYSF